MKGLVKYLQEIYSNCEVPFEVNIDNKTIFKSHPSSIKGEVLEHKFSIGSKCFSIIVEEKYKDCINLLKFCIKNKCKEVYNEKEKIIKKLLQNINVSKEKLKETMPSIKNDTFLITLSLKEKLVEALEVLKNIYSDIDVIILIYEETIILVGSFEDINEHVSSINETINLSLYEKCYISYSYIGNYELLNNLYNENIYKINLAQKYNLTSMILGPNSLLFEKTMDNLNEEIKGQILDNFRNSFLELDEDMVKTVDVFLKLDLNLSEAAKELYVHRNTLIYRLDKIQKHTGYDIRKFNDAALFKIAFFIWKQQNKAH